MSKTYASIPVIHLNAGSSFLHPPEPPKVAHIDDPALNVMVDYRHANAITISPEAYIPEAAMEMRVCHTHLLLVIDDAEKIRGLITSEDLMGEKPLQITMQKRIKRSDIQVKMVMTAQKNIAVFDLTDLRHAKVGNIITTLHELKQHDALVVEVESINSKQSVCGFFSLSQISKQLGFDVTSDISKATTLYELQHRYKD